MEQSRETQFADKLSSRTWQEVPSQGNPYLSTRQLCHGYDLLELSRNCDTTDMLFLLLKGELPDASAKDLLRRLSVVLCSPGPRHPASRAVMNAAASGTGPQHLLPIGLTLMGGDQQGAESVRSACRFIGKNLRNCPAETAKGCIEHIGNQESDDTEYLLAPGFGRLYGDIDPWAASLAASLAESPGAGRAMQWCREFVVELQKADCGWLVSGVAAAAFTDLGVPARSAMMLFQLCAAPGLLTHAMEMAGKSILDLPFLDESQCELLEGDQ